MEDQTTPVVSLLVPICNVERYLRECLDSAAAQTLRDIEVICINDGSTDGSLDLITEYVARDGRFRVIDKPNSGYGDSMNQGIAVARGTYIGILESDDFMFPDALEKLVVKAQQTNAQVVKGDFFLYWSTPEQRKELFNIIDKPMLGDAYCPIDRPGIFYKKPSIWSARTISIFFPRLARRIKMRASTLRYGLVHSVLPSSMTLSCAIARTTKSRPSTRRTKFSACVTNTRKCNASSTIALS